MKETLLELWNGNISPWSDNFVRVSEERRLYRSIDENRVRLKEILNENGEKLLDSFGDCYMELSLFLREEAFVNGFSLGMKIAIESLGK